MNKVGKKGSCLGIAALLLAGIACGGDDVMDMAFSDGGPVPDGGDGEADSDVADTPDAMPAPDAAINSDGPDVSVVSPTEPASGDFAAGAIITNDRFTVICEAEPNSDSNTSVDLSSVVVSVFQGGLTVDTAQATFVGGNQFTASINGASADNGALEIRCTASDTADPPRTNSASADTFIDFGPAVRFFNPDPSSAEADFFAQQVEVRFEVQALEVASGDTGASVNDASVSVFVAGVELPAVTDLGGGAYSVNVDFDSPLFNPTLQGAQLVTIQASNQRSGGAVTRTSSAPFVADVNGPIVTLEAPAPGQLISGIITVRADVSDEAAVDPQSVVGTMAGVFEFPMELVAGKYEGTFDTRQLSNLMVYPNLVVRARDAVGNESSDGYVVALDNTTPVASLDPPDMREGRLRVVDDVIECSLLFDPVGEDSVDDGEIVAQLSELRVRVEDRPNGATAASTVIFPLAGVQEDATQLYILDDTNNALIVDTDGDGVCDDINPLLIPTTVPAASNEAALVNLVSRGPAGISDFRPEGDDANYLASGHAQCNPVVDPPQAPQPLCLSVDNTRVIEANNRENAIFGIPPFDEDQCMGNAFDAFATNISDGWACAAVVAFDRLGNRGISAPLRVCIDRDGSGNDGCSNGQAWGQISTDAFPDCSGSYDSDTNTTNAAANCTFPDSFADDGGWQFRRIDL